MSLYKDFPLLNTEFAYMKDSSSFLFGWPGIFTCADPGNPDKSLENFLTYLSDCITDPPRGPVHNALIRQKPYGLGQPTTG